MGPRRRASTVKGSNEEIEELQRHFRDLSYAAESSDLISWLASRVQTAQAIQQFLLNDAENRHPQDAFRHLGGFQILLGIINETVSECNSQKTSSGDFGRWLDLLQASFRILAAALRSHMGNQRYFQEKTQGNGWSVLRDTMARGIDSHSELEPQARQSFVDCGFAGLLACALDYESVIRFSVKQLDKEHPNGRFVTILGEIESIPQTSAEEGAYQKIIQSIETGLGPSPLVKNANALFVLFELWIRSEEPSCDIHSWPVPRLLIYLINSSTNNLASIHDTHILSLVLSRICQATEEEKWRQAELFTLAACLLCLGISKLDDAYLLFRSSRASPTIAKLLSSALEDLQVSSYVHFDLSTYGYVSVELPGMAHDFPPMSSSNGYTLTMWFQVVQFDSNSHTTLFGAFDSSQSCFVLVYLERDTHHLILQTSIKSSRPSVRFKSVSFQEGCWYHIALTHKRPRTTSSSKASLFVNGEFVEQVKSQYPSLPSRAPNELGMNGRTDITGARNPVQTFFGTPQDLAARLGKNLILTQWRLASAQLFSDIISDDLLAVYYRLGPRYSGNFQDCLGSFQTYEASAQLNLRNESLHPGKEEKSDLVLAIRSKAGDLLPEAKILLNISASNVYVNTDLFCDSSLQRLTSLSRSANRKLHAITRGGLNAIALNGSYPRIDQAVLNTSGHAVLTGDPTPVNRRLLDDAAWQIGGCTAVCLALVDGAEDEKTFTQSLIILTSTLRSHWRNSEAVERENGFGILANIIASKLKQFDSVSMSPGPSSSSNHEDTISLSPSLETLYILLEFVGFCKDRPEDSVINNPLAYRTLIVDLDVWRNLSMQVQRLYYDQFVIFAKKSKYHQFNSKRLSRMRIVKKWLEVLKHQQFTAVTFKYFIECFEVLLTRNFTAEVMRSLALFITYAVYQPERRVEDISRRKSTRLRASTPTRRRTVSASKPGDATASKPDTIVDSDTTQLKLLQIGVGVLQLYANILLRPNDVTSIQKFARTVTNKAFQSPVSMNWLLYLIAESQSSIVIEAVKIFSRLLTLSGSNYRENFAKKKGGLVIMRHNLQRHWDIPAIWLACFATLLGKDIANINLQKFDLFTLIETFGAGDKIDVVAPEILPLLTTLLRNGFLALTKQEPELASPVLAKDPVTPAQSSQSTPRSLTVTTATTKSPTKSTADSLYVERSAIIRTVIRFLADLHTKSQAFRDLSANSSYIQDLFLMLFPVVVSANAVSAETELNARNSALTFNGGDVAMKPVSADQRGTLIVRTTGSHQQSNSRPDAPKRMSSYELVTSQAVLETPKSEASGLPQRSRSRSNLSDSMVQEILELVLAVFYDQIFARKDFPGLGLFMRVPPGFQEHQAYFETFILRNALSQLSNHIKLNQKLLWEPRILTNLSRLSVHLAEAICEGWFINGADVTFGFLADILEYLQLPEISIIKSVRLCSGTIAHIRAIFFRNVLLRLSALDKTNSSNELINLLDKLAYWQTALLPSQDPNEDLLRQFCYLIYAQFSSPQDQVRMAAANVWRLLLVHKYAEISAVLIQTADSRSEGILKGFKSIVELDNETFLAWVDNHRSDLHHLFTPLSKDWSNFVTEEDHRTEHTAKARIAKRRERLKIWAADEFKIEESIRRHETSGNNWRSNIYHTEQFKRQRSLQDQQDARIFVNSAWKRMQQELHGPCGLLEDDTTSKWHLDQTEGRNRMRMRLIPDKEVLGQEFQPKRRQSQGPVKHRSSLSASSTPARGASPIPTQKQPREALANGRVVHDDPLGLNMTGGDGDDQQSEDGFEMVDDPTAELEEFEDKNRKVMRSIERGDQVQFVHNASRIVGLEAVEGLLIIGKQHLYILDNLFQRLDGEIVNVTNAPEDERDSYLQMTSGHKKSQKEVAPAKTDFETRHWSWDEILSISKRRFLFRDVAIEVFFVDGQSYLLTSRDSSSRDELYQRLLTKAPISAANGTTSNEEENWRADSIRNTEEMHQSLGARFTNVFAQQISNPATRKWAKGEISNFHYLMQINTMAGRTFNDLTQYPVFPWVLADYTSEKLDLSNPRSFRDLSKPMGCQTLARQSDFNERYQSFAEMGDDKAPPFHYGTHYSSAMIVTSYLIRLQPFVHSYLLLQGGYFDHPDRLFYSIADAWNSASQTNMTDVRELIPEFYYLPEFLSNMNQYDFGERQGGQKIDKVSLPPWAKGDPKIFITKHREALESDYVRQNLHGWIDLVFGHKQRGEAALEATNVFHHLSYHGARDLDTIHDPVERLATIGIIHNFGQTPLQVFTRPHVAHEPTKSPPKGLDLAAEDLTRLPFPVLETQDRIASLQWSVKQEKVVQTGPSKLHMGPTFDKYMEWGFFDGGIRFYMSESKRLVGLFEHIHIGEISAALFADSKTLITGGNDCTISVWSVSSTAKAVDLQPRKSLYGHRTAINTLVVSRSFSTLLSASSDGKIILWDLNRIELVRVLTTGKFVECARINDVTGTIAVCRGSEVSLWTLNGDFLLKQEIQSDGDDSITSCAFYEGNGHEYLERQLVFTGHKRGVVNVGDHAPIS
ncbi:uncharacterized protein KY384_000530 [Bacidia gigantensis]|uniref:uncharacterized protein n=1 Tax=Bacidia gigantensis TaxID=2732470 RepID=UPI001D04CECD|nr:uncharacterized protein KY384_000530 [Bacidia gigantensis]KAG8525770.1 hypothetical protein KY384_000530 [Bacidia gigantensis]